MEVTVCLQELRRAQILGMHHPELMWSPLTCLLLPFWAAWLSHQDAWKKGMCNCGPDCVTWSVFHCGEKGKRTPTTVALVLSLIYIEQLGISANWSLCRGDKHWHCSASFITAQSGIRNQKVTMKSTWWGLFSCWTNQPGSEHSVAMRAALGKRTRLWWKHWRMFSWTAWKA